MKLVDIAARNAKDAENIVKRALATLRKQTNHIGYVDQGFVGGVYIVTIQTNIPEYAIDTLEDLIRKSERATLITSKVYPGSFDWAADTYIKDAAYVSFKF